MSADPYRCIHCHWWQFNLGCTIPETPATVNCGRTGPDDGCEQWIDREARRWRRHRMATRPKRLRGLILTRDGWKRPIPDVIPPVWSVRFRQQIATDMQRRIRELHYLDGAITGYDTQDMP